MPTESQPQELSVQVISTVGQFAELEKDWNRVCGEIPFRSFQWNYQWWQRFGGQRSLLVLVAYDANACVGIAPFYVDRKLGLGSVVEFIGSGEVASDHLSILSLPERSSAVGSAMAGWFACRANPGKQVPSNALGLDDAGALLQLDGIAPECPTFKAFTDKLEQLRFSVYDRSTVHTWRIELPSSMDAYLAMLSKPCRRKVRTALKQFDAATFQIVTADCEESFDANWLSFTNLHQRRRQSLGEHGCFANDAFTGFLRDIARHFHQIGCLDLVCISSAQGPIAAEICFMNRTTSFAYQIGIEPDALEHNPGWLVNTASIRRAIDLGLSSFDLCRGDSEYKRQLGATPNVCKKLRIVPPRLRSQLINTAMVAGSTIKHFCQDLGLGASSRS